MDNTNLFEYNYNKKKLLPKWTHIGLSNFHRTHQARILHESITRNEINLGLLVYNLEGQKKETVNILTKNNFNYHHLINGDNQESITKIGSIVKAENISKKNIGRILNELIEFNIEILTITITEAGYHFLDDELDINSTDINSDIKNNTTKTIYSFLYQFLYLKKKNNQKKIDIISCDNIIKNSEKLQSLFYQYCQIKDSKILRWVKNNVNFCNSMVDRITPSYDESLRKKIKKKYNVDDKCYVHSEEYFQWVIADCNNNYLKKLNKSGVQFVKNVNDHQQMKNLMLNASHCSTSFLSCLYGNRYVYQTFNNDLFIDFIDSFLTESVIPFLKKTKYLEYENFKSKIFSRFSNKNIKDQSIRTTHNGSDNLIQFIFPSLIKNFKNKKNLKKFALIYSSWYVFLNKFEKKLIVDKNLNKLKYLNNYDNFLTQQPYPGIQKYIDGNFKIYFLKYVDLLQNKKINLAIKDAT